MDDLIRKFNLAFYDSLIWEKTTWLGVPTLKVPTDLWVYQEILNEVRPQVIIECGTYRGGSALFLASICDLLGTGEIITIDVTIADDLPAHPRIHYLVGSSTDPATLDQLRRTIPDGTKCMVILDSDHSAEHVLAELRAYQGFVSPGSYMIVEDTNINGHPVLPNHGPGPMEAVAEFLQECADFRPDASREKFGLTFNPRGYLLCSRSAEVSGETGGGQQLAWSTWITNPLRDCEQVIATLRQQVLEVTSWAERAVADVEQRDEIIQGLQRQVNEQTAWAQRAVADVIERDQIIHKLQQQLAETTSRPE